MNTVFYDTPNDYEQKQLCVIVVDNKDINQRTESLLNTYIRRLLSTINSDPYTCEQIEISIVTNENNGNVLIPPSVLKVQPDWINSFTGPSNVISLFYNLDSFINSRTKWYTNYGIPYYKPWLFFLVTKNMSYVEKKHIAHIVNNSKVSKKYNFAIVNFTNTCINETDFAATICVDYTNTQIIRELFRFQQFSCALYSSNENNILPDYGDPEEWLI